MPFGMLLCADDTPALNWAEEQKTAVLFSETSAS